MEVLKTSQALKREIDRLKAQKKKIGFVPTMGFLHEGHLSLVRAAKKESDIVISSLFVNPLQFGPKEDFKRYPRNFRRDSLLLKKTGVDFLFAPDAADLYPTDFQTAVSVSRVSLPLCGRSRPTHFAGVTTVVLKLLNLVRPDILYLGQKDFQQVRVIEQMIEDLDLGVRVRRMPTVREADGLAMSSRNVLLSENERREALSLSKALKKTGQAILSGVRDAKTAQQILQKGLKEASSGRVDYAEIVDAKTLAPVVKLHPGDRVLVAVAVFFSKTRLIDNLLVKVG